MWIKSHKLRPEHFVLPVRMRVMLRMYGYRDGARCGQCKHLVRHDRGGVWYKCALTQQTSGRGTDWKPRWPACGKFEERSTP